MLDVLTGLVGRWKVSGHAHHTPVQGCVEVTMMVQGCWLMARETLVDAQGLSVHEDLCLYGRDPLSGDLQVHHFQEDGVVEVHTVLPTDDGQGVHWVPRGSGPRVELRREGSGWCVRVLTLEASTPEIEIHYTPLS